MHHDILGVDILGIDILGVDILGGHRAVAVGSGVQEAPEG